MNLFSFGNLGPEIRLFIGAAALLGPITIILLIYFLKIIEKKDPSKVRWR